MATNIKPTPGNKWVALNPRAARIAHLKNERDGIKTFLSKLSAAAQINGLEWSKRMREHYRKRLREINAEIKQLR